MCVCVCVRMCTCVRMCMSQVVYMFLMLCFGSFFCFFDLPYSGLFLLYIIIIIIIIIDACLYTNERKKVWIWMGGEVRRIWEELGEKQL